MEKSFFVVPIFIVLAAVAMITFVDIPQANDLQLDTNATIVAGEYEACITPYTEIACAKGLECILISEKPQRNGMCLPPGTELKEDFINRYIEDQIEINRRNGGTPIDLGEVTGLE